MLHEAIHKILSSLQYDNYPGVVPQEAPLPYMVQRITSRTPSYTKDTDRRSLKDRVIYQIAICTADYVKGETTAEQARNLMEGAQGDKMGVYIESIRLINEAYVFEESAQAHVFNQNYEILINRT